MGRERLALYRERRNECYASITSHYSTMTMINHPAATPALVDRVVSLEGRMADVETKLQSVSDDTAAIRKAVVGVTRVGTFAKKHGRFVVGLIIGSLYASGFLSPITFSRLKLALAYVTLPPSEIQTTIAR